MPELRRREKTLQAEVKSIADQTNDRAAYLRMTETLSTFMARLRSSAQTLDITERQRIVRLLVKEVLVSDDTIIIRHSIPIPTGPSSGGDTDAGSERPPASSGGSSLLRKGSNRAALWSTLFCTDDDTILHCFSIEPLSDQAQNHWVSNAVAISLRSYCRLIRVK